MNPARVELPQWDCAVAVVDGRLCAGRATVDEDDEGDSDGLVPVDFLCTSFLNDASHALGVSFTTDEFDVVACDGCVRPDGLALRITSTP